MLSARRLEIIATRLEWPHVYGSFASIVAVRACNTPISRSWRSEYSMLFVRNTVDWLAIELISLMSTLLKSPVSLLNANSMPSC